jgi:hypothetical protein
LVIIRSLFLADHISATFRIAATRPVEPVTRVFLETQAAYVADIASRKRLRFGRFGLLGNLEKVPEAFGFGVSKSICELAVPSLRRSLMVRESMSAEVRRE